MKIHFECTCQINVNVINKNKESLHLLQCFVLFCFSKVVLWSMAQILKYGLCCDLSKEKCSKYETEYCQKVTKSVEVLLLDGVNIAL